MDWAEESKHVDAIFKARLKENNIHKNQRDEVMGDEFYMNRPESLTVEEMDDEFYQDNTLHRAKSLTHEEMGGEFFTDNALNMYERLTVEMDDDSDMDNTMNRSTRLTVDEMGGDLYVANALNRSISLTVGEMDGEFDIPNDLNRSNNLTVDETDGEFDITNARNKSSSLTVGEAEIEFDMVNVLNKSNSLTVDETNAEVDMATALSRSKCLTVDTMDEFDMANALNESKSLTVDEMDGEFYVANTLKNSEEMGDEFCTDNTLNRPKGLTGEEMGDEFRMANSLKSPKSGTDEEIVQELRVAKPRSRPKRVKVLTDEEIFKELCLANGINSRTKDFSSIASLEIFFHGFPRMVGLCHFPRLCKLTIVNQSIRKIHGLECCPLLKELWVVECRLKEISGIQNCLHLQKLYLYDNQISEIENLELHVNLQVLWLNNNYITDIGGLGTLKELKELNLADNCIENIGHSLDLNMNLQHLNLSGNKISSFKELTLLAKLPHLKKLELKCPLSISNPVCLLFNYAIHVLYHLPRLRRLDNYDVSSKQVKQAAESTVMKKMMYYNMRVRTAQKRKLAEIQDNLLKQKNTVSELPVERIRELRYAIKGLECEFSERLHCCKKLRCKMEILRGRLQHWDKKLEEIETWYKHRLSQTTSRNAFMVNCLLIEMKTLGNVRFEEGCSADPWFMSCHDLVQSRFSAPDYLHHGITGVKVNHIVRIHNRALMLRFDDKLHSLLGFEGLFSVFSQNSKQRLDYLFYRSDPECTTEQNGTLYIAEEGFQNPEMYKALGREGAVPLSNSLFVAEQPRIEYAQRNVSQSSSRLNKDSVPFRHGQIILAKVFFGRCFPIREGDPVESSCYPKAHSVYRSVHSCCAASSLTQSQWFVFDHELVLPEYIIDFEYTTQDPAPPALPSLGMGQDHILLDEKAINMEPMLKPRPKLSSLDEEILLNVTKADALSQITVLNLTGNSLKKLTEISSMQALRQLTVSFNELTHLDDISHMPNLEFVDASHNNLVTLDGMRGLGQLRELDLRWNQLARAREEMIVLRKHAPSLQKLDTRHNPWQRPETLRMTILGRLKDLRHLDDVLVAEDKDAAVQKPTGSIINQSSLLTHSRTDSDQPCSLSLLSTAQLICQMSPAPWDLNREPDPGWMYKITALNLDSQGISKLSNLDKLISLRWASFNNNDISKLEGLDNCLRLEELSLDDNCITSMDGLPKLCHLSKLSLNGNRLSRLEPSVLGQLPYLHFLSVENNRINSMSGIQKARSLFELYIGNNHICTTRDISNLKSLRKLVILNLHGNPLVEKTEHYRIYMVFQLPSLKALDGITVDVNEKENAKDVFGGRLTPDTIAEKLGHSNYSDITHLRLCSSSIRVVDLAPADLFQNLHHVIFDHNNLKSFSGLIDLPKVKFLSLNHNSIDSILPRQQVQAHMTTRQVLHHKVTSSGYGQQNKGSRDGPTESLEPLMDSLEVLHLSHNGISNMAKLQLSRFKSLKSLFLQSNDISQVEGLEGLRNLRELALDRNRIKAFSHNSFIGQTALVELRLAENRIRELNHLDPMVKLCRLFLDKNSLRDVTELDKLEVLPSLTELSLIDNLVSRRSIHRIVLVQRLSKLQILDGVIVTHEERAGAELLNTDTLCPSASMPTLSPPGNVSLKMTSLSGGQQKGMSEDRTQKQMTKFKLLKSPTRSKLKRQFQIQMLGQEGPK